MEIDKVITELSTKGLISLLNEYEHIRLETIEGREELNAVAQCNLDTDEIDYIEFLTVLSGE